MNRKNGSAPALLTARLSGHGRRFSLPFQDKFDIRRILRRKSPFFRVKLKIFLLCG